MKRRPSRYDHRCAARALFDIGGQTIHKKSEMLFVRGTFRWSSHLDDESSCVQHILNTV